MSEIYPQNAKQVPNHVPALISKLILPQLQRFVGSNVINDLTILYSYIQHIICWIPMSFDIARDKLHMKSMSSTGIMPCRKDNGGRMDNSEGEFVNL